MGFYSKICAMTIGLVLSGGVAHAIEYNAGNFPADRSDVHG